MNVDVQEVGQVMQQKKTFLKILTQLFWEPLLFFWIV